MRTVPLASLALTILVASPLKTQSEELTLSELTRLLVKERLDDAKFAAFLDRARSVDAESPLEPRLMAVRALGMSAARGEAQPADYSQLIRAIGDESLLVRTAARRALRNATLPSRVLVKRFRKALLTELRREQLPTATRSEIESLRERLLAQLKPAEPGGPARQDPRKAARKTPAKSDSDAPDPEKAKRALRKLLGIGGLAYRRLSANESAAIATLRNIASAQAQCQAMGILDNDGDGAGEYGFFGELSGATQLRADQVGEKMSEKRMSPPVLSGAFGKLERSRVARSGYLFQLYLPDAELQPVAEAAKGGGKGRKISARHAEVRWCVVAWPITHGKSGNRAFFVDQGGDVYACANAFADYSGHDRAPLPDAARATTRAARSTMKDEVAQDKLGRDANSWRIVH